MTNKQKILTVYWVTFSGSIIWTASIFLAPLMKSQSVDWAGFVYAAYSTVCHQIPDRCFHLWGYPLAVCSRCLGIYSGVLTGLLLFPAVKGFRSVSVPPTWLFVLVSTPIVLDTIGNFSLAWMTSPWVRFSIGWTWGIILPFYFIAGISDVWIQHRKNEDKNS